MKPMIFKPEVYEVIPFKKILWGGSFLKILYRGDHAFLLELTPKGKTRFRQIERFRGPMVLFMGSMIKKTEVGYHQMNVAFKEQVEKKQSVKKWNEEARTANKVHIHSAVGCRAIAPNRATRSAANGASVSGWQFVFKTKFFFCAVSPESSPKPIPMPEQQILKKLKADYPNLVMDWHPFPKTYRGRAEIKAIIPGADPTRILAGTTPKLGTIAIYCLKVSLLISWQLVRIQQTYWQSCCQHLTQWRAITQWQ